MLRFEGVNVSFMNMKITPMVYVDYGHSDFATSEWLLRTVGRKSWKNALNRRQILVVIKKNAIFACDLPVLRICSGKRT